MFAIVVGWEGIRCGVDILWINAVVDEELGLIQIPT